MGALRRRQVVEAERPHDGEAPGSAGGAPGRRYPRWVVVSGLIAYCAVFWVIIWAAGSWGVQLARMAVAGTLE